MIAAGLPLSFTGLWGALVRRMPGVLMVLGLSLALASSAQAARVLPSGMLVGVVDSAEFPTITLKLPKPSWLLRVASLGLYDKTVSYSVAVSVRIRNQSNLFVVYGMMPQLKDKFVALKDNGFGQVNQIWVLTEAEAEEYVTRPGTRFPAKKADTTATKTTETEE